MSPSGMSRTLRHRASVVFLSTAALTVTFSHLFCLWTIRDWPDPPLPVPFFVDPLALLMVLMFAPLVVLAVFGRQWVLAKTFFILLLVHVFTQVVDYQPYVSPGAHPPWVTYVPHGNEVELYAAAACVCMGLGKFFRRLSSKGSVELSRMS